MQYDSTVAGNQNCGSAHLSRIDLRFQKTCRARQALRRHIYLQRRAAS
jgi:hypothetical protein